MGASKGPWGVSTVVVPPLPPTFIPGWNFAGFGGSGGPGSDGGDGGFGGHGGQGGDGGAGAGAVEFLVQGNITLDGSANAIGGHGEAGSAGLSGLQGYAPGEYDEAEPTEHYTDYTFDDPDDGDRFIAIVKATATKSVAMTSCRKM